MLRGCNAIKIKFIDESSRSINACDQIANESTGATNFQNNGDENEIENNEKIWCKISIDLEPKINLESQSTDQFFGEMINYLNDGLLP